MGRERTASAGTGYPVEITGFGNALHGLYSGLDNIGNGIRPESAMEVVLKAYNYMKTCYDHIPFGEMDTNDEDFRFLFDYRDELESLGKRLQTFRTLFESGSAISQQSPEFAAVIEELERLKGKNYRRAVLKKHGIDLSEPASNQ